MAFFLASTGGVMASWLVRSFSQREVSDQVVAVGTVYS